MTVDDYLNLITSEFRQQPNFTGAISAVTAVTVRIQDLLLSLTEKFDIDVATGQQLDVIGQWVGITRNVAIPISGVYFSWNDTSADGWDFGTWQPSNLPTDVTSLPDDAYRTLIKAKIAANGWNGTIEGAYAIWDRIFTNFTILIQDNQNMSYDLILIGGIVDSLTLALLTGGYIPLKPEGVRVHEYFVPVDSNPGFAWDIENDLLKGWNEGSWLREIKPT